MLLHGVLYGRQFRRARRTGFGPPHGTALYRLRIGGKVPQKCNATPVAEGSIF